MSGVTVLYETIAINTTMKTLQYTIYLNAIYMAWSIT